MTSETTGASGRRGGRDLRSELLRTSRELLDEAGPSALSMREVARRAGCTHQAPYHYFANREAILAAEDDEFFSHHGIDLPGVARAILANIKSGGRGQGASTITMQLARTTFLSRERKFTRKFYEVLLTLRIEQELTKQQIFEIYAPTSEN